MYYDYLFRLNIQYSNSEIRLRKHALTAIHFKFLYIKFQASRLCTSWLYVYIFQIYNPFWYMVPGEVWTICMFSIITND